MVNTSDIISSYKENKVKAIGHCFYFMDPFSDKTRLNVAVRKTTGIN